MATAVTMPNETYIFGGKFSRTSEFLRNDVWQEGPMIPNGFQQGCGVKISPHEIILIGGEGTEDRVIKLDVRNNTFTLWSPLKQERRGHSCILLNNNILVVGGINHGGQEDELKSTEIISLTHKIPRNGGSLNIARSYFGLAAVGGHFKRILSFGGNSGNSVEQWNEETEQWKMSPFSLQKSRGGFGSVAVPPSVICPSKN